jgi:hypothetical protein
MTRANAATSRNIINARESILHNLLSKVGHRQMAFHALLIEVMDQLGAKP